MQTKLTLRLDDELIAAAKSYAREHGRSLSQIVADYFASLSTVLEASPEEAPLVHSLRGCLKGAEVDENDYRRHLEEKYL